MSKHLCFFCMTEKDSTIASMHDPPAVICEACLWDAVDRLTERKNRVARAASLASRVPWGSFDREAEEKAKEEIE